MKAYLILFTILFFLLALDFPSILDEANEKVSCCYQKGGVACNLGSDSDHSVICANGYRESNCQYVSQCLVPNTNKNQPQQVLAAVTERYPKQKKASGFTKFKRMLGF